MRKFETLIKEGFRFVGIEREKDFFNIAKARIEHFANKKPKRTLFSVKK